MMLEINTQSLYRGAYLKKKKKPTQLKLAKCCDAEEKTCQYSGGDNYLFP